MYRYLALVWDACDPGHTVEADRLVGALRARGSEWTSLNPIGAAAPPSSRGGLALFHTGSRSGVTDTEVLPADGGAVFGTLFRAGSPGPRARLDDGDRRAILASRGSVLLASHWGRYVAIVRTPSHGVSILRDPTGGLPCLLAFHRGVWMLFSDVEDALSLGLQVSVNWRFVRALIADFGLQSSETGLEQITEVQPGESIELHGATLRRTQRWNPLEIARADPIDAPSAAAAALRESVLRAVHAWAGCHPRILHRLSGGLDSAIVLAALCEAPAAAEVTCLNYFGGGPQEDERAFARRAVARSRSPLIEQPLEPDRARLEPVLRATRTARPYFYLYALEHGRFEAALAASLGATALFSGAGGDALFYRNRAALAAADAMHRHGVGRQMFRAALDAATIERTSVWSVLADALHNRLRHDTWSRVAGDGAPAHPWLREARRSPPGKVWQVRSIGAPLPYYDPLGQPDDAESVQPLLQQPVIETCVRIPTPTLVSGGWDRAIARRAFLHDLPPEIVRRRGKGASTATALRLFESNLPFLRDLLLDGWLVREGLLQRRALEAALTTGATLR
ncbi:MAG: asparagine synthase-related protein, partial [Steroidobacteraceae bacterium]